VDRPDTVADWMTSRDVARGALVGLCVAGDHVGVAVAGAAACFTGDAAQLVGAADEAIRPRWVVWSQETAAALIGGGTRIAVCWDLVAVHRLLFGGWRADPGRIWARTHDLATSGLPSGAPPDLFSAAADTSDPGVPVRPDGHLQPAWADGGWRADPERIATWAALALDVAARQHAALAALTDRPMALATARAESTAELLCAELAADGLPLDRSTVEAIIESFTGPRPRTEADAAAQRASRDAAVLRHAPPGTTFVLRNSGQVKSLLRATGIEVADTRAWRLEAMRDAHPVIDDLLVWRKAERIATTYGYAWLDEHAADGRLRGTWSGSDGAAGRMTATAGLHNMPADLRPAVVADPGHVLVRADLGQIEPRVLAAVSGDRALAEATREDDMYAPVAKALDVDRATAKVAVLGAMYGQTTGHGAAALRRLDAAYPVAMAFLNDAAVSGQVGRDIRTYGGRLVRLGPIDEPGIDDREARSRAAARGRYGRNAAVQGAAAELFKVWAVTVRARSAALGARIVLCLHDELLVHAPAQTGDAVAALLADALAEAAYRWAPDDTVRFVADISVVDRWSDAKGEALRPRER
jgi:DNA polymerase family A